MANTRTQRIINKAIYNNVSLEAERTETFGISKWTLFRTLFFGRIGTVVLANVLAMIFALPAMAVLVLFSFNSSLAVGLVPYSGNIGFGMTVTVDAASVGAATAFDFLVYECLFLLPCISVFGLGFAGNMFVMNKLASGEEVKVFKDFFRGIKRGGLSGFVLGTLIGIVVVGVVLSVDFFDIYGLHVAYKVVSLILTIMLLVFLSMFTAFYTTQTAAFKLPVRTRIRNAFLFLIGTNVQAIIFIGIAVAPTFLVMIPSMLALFIMIYVLLGVSFTTLVIVLFCRGCYEKYTLGKAPENKPTTYAKRENTDVEPTVNNTDSADTVKPVDSANDKPSKKKPVQQYKNPKKGKRTDTVGLAERCGTEPNVDRTGDGKDGE